MALCAAAILLILGLMIALIAVCETYRRAALPATATSDTTTASEATTTADLCLTPGCIGTPAHTFKKIAVCLLLNRRKVSTWLQKFAETLTFFLLPVFLEFVRLVSGSIFVLYRARDNNIFCHWFSVV
jgi:hypothetical protein